jgi:hypothetical protein
MQELPPADAASNVHTSLKLRPLLLTLPFAEGLNPRPFATLSTIQPLSHMGLADKVLKPIQCVGLNPYKIVEAHKNYRPHVPIEYHSDVMYVEPSEEVWLKVKVEKMERLEFRANLKEKKYAGKEQIESVVFNDG